MSHSLSHLYIGNPCRLDNRAACVHRSEFAGLSGNQFAVIVPGDTRRPNLVITWENLVRELELGSGEFHSNDRDLGFVRKAR